MNARSEYRGAVTGVALIAAIVLVSITVDIGLPGQSILQSLRFHLAAACLLLPVALFVLRAPRRALAMLAVILVSVGLGAWPLWQLQQRRAPLAEQPAVAALDVVSFNVLATNEEAGKVVGYLLTETPDIAIIMETPGIEDFLADLKDALPYRVGCDKPATCDTSILSRLPLIDARVVPLVPYGTERLIIAGVEVDGQRATIVAIHLSKPYFDGMSTIQLQQLREELAKIEGPIVLGGDFNAAPWSDELVAFAASADMIPPPAPPATWPVKAGGLGIPIDNLFTRGTALIESIAALPDAMGSNHRGLRARIDLVGAR